MKILFFSDHAHLALEPDTRRVSGGSQLQVALMSRELAARGHDVVILAADTGQPDGVVWDGVKIRKAGRFDTGGLADSLRALPGVVKILREERPDHVVVNGWTAWLYILCQLRRIVPFRLSYVCALDTEINGVFRRDNPFRGLLLDLGMHEADSRLSITEHQARLYREQGMDCSVSRLLLRNADFVPGEKTVDLLWLSRCNPVKRPHLFLDLAEKLPRARCRMICTAQDKTLWNEVSRRAAAIPNVEFLESVPYREAQGHFGAARVFVNTSEHEGVPNTFIEAGLGRAAILSLLVDPDGMFETFAAGGSAHGDFPLFVKMAGALLDEPDAAATAGAESARFVREWHNNAANVQAFLDGIGAA